MSVVISLWPTPRNWISSWGNNLVSSLRYSDIHWHTYIYTHTHTHIVYIYIYSIVYIYIYTNTVIYTHTQSLSENLCQLLLLPTDCIYFLYSCQFNGQKMASLCLFVCLFMAVLGLHCCAQAFSSCGERGLLFVAVCELLIVVASLAVEHGL